MIYHPTSINETTMSYPNSNQNGPASGLTIFQYKTSCEQAFVGSGMGTRKLGYLPRPKGRMNRPTLNLKIYRLKPLPIDHNVPHSNQILMFHSLRQQIDMLFYGHSKSTRRVGE
jgi:hypothetical protein